MWQTVETIMQESWRELTVQFARVLPNVFASVLIFGVGVVAGVIVGGVARCVLVAAKVDRGAARLGLAGPLARLGIPSTARLIARVLRWTTIAVAFVPALYTLDARVASDLVGRALLYLPHLAVAAALLWAGTAFSRFLSRSVLIAAVNHELSSPRLLAAATRVGVILATVAVVLRPGHRADGVCDPLRRRDPGRRTRRRPRQPGPGAELAGRTGRGQATGVRRPGSDRTLVAVRSTVRRRLPSAPPAAA